MSERYIIKRDDENEQFKIIDTGHVVGGDKSDYVWIASVYDPSDALKIVDMLNEKPLSPIQK